MHLASLRGYPEILEMVAKWKQVQQVQEGSPLSEEEDSDDEEETNCPKLPTEDHKTFI